MMIALLSARSQSIGVVWREGNTAVRTWGIESPTIIQNATIPPNALWKKIDVSLWFRVRDLRLESVES